MLSSSLLPVVDISRLVAGEPATSVATEIGNACRQQGFFYIVGHGVDMELQEQLEHLSREFFHLDLEAKMAIRMELSGRAWRGYFPVGNEMTSGVPDAKEGLYFGSELPADHPKVAAQTPLHGCNLFPGVPGFRETLLDYLDAVTDLGEDNRLDVAIHLLIEFGFL